MHTGLLRKKSRHSAGFFSYLLLVPTPRRAKHDTPRPHTGPRANKVCVGGFWGGGHWCVLVTGGQTVGGVVRDCGIRYLLSFVIARERNDRGDPVNKKALRADARRHIITGLPQSYANVFNVSRSFAMTAGLVTCVSPFAKASGDKPHPPAR